MNHMKKLCMPLLLLLTAASCQAQVSHLDAFYRKFDAAGGESAKGTINLSLLLNLAATDSSDNWLGKVTLCRFMTLDPEKSPKAGEEWSELQQSLKEDHFEELMSARHGKDNFRMLSCDRSDGQEDLVCMAMSRQGGGVVFHIRGKFSASDREKIRNALRVRES